MRIWKKALSTAMSAALLASLLGTAFASTAFAADTTYLNAACTPADCSQVADGASLIELTFAASDFTNGGSVTITGATFQSVSGADLALTSPTYITVKPVANAIGEKFRVQAPAAAGTATITVWALNGSLVNTSMGTKTLTFVAAGSLTVSAANSTVTLDKTTVKADGTEAAINVDVVVKNGASTPAVMTTGLTVSATITPVGVIAKDALTVYAQVATDNAAGTVTANAYEFNIQGSGIPGTATVAFSVTDSNNVTTSLGTKTVTFSGDVASIAATSNMVALAKGGALVADVVRFTAKDAAGNAVKTTGATVVVTGSVFTAPVTGAAVTQDFDPSLATAALQAGKVSVDCNGTAGSGTIAIKMVVSATVTVTSNAVTVYCSDPAASMTIAFDKETVAPAGGAMITVSVKDKNGQPAPDAVAGTVAIAVSSGVAYNGDGSVTNGEATWNFLAPFNTGVVTAAATSGTLTPVSTQINVGAVVPAASGTNGSALGATKTGTFTAASKIAALGKYQTFQLCYGAGAAGQMVGILVATKNSAGVWSSFTRLTGRAADSSGCAYFWWRTASAAWISVRGDLGGTLTPAVQGRWR